MKNLVNKLHRLEEEIEKTEKRNKKEFFITEMRKIGIEKLPYAKTALKKFIDAETMDFHYNKHYKGYVEKLNLALSKENFGDLELEQIVKSISRYNKTIRNNAGGAYNHALFWKMLSPNPQKPKELVSQRINKDFGTFNKFKKEFENVAKERFGSGWVWLVVTKNNRFKIMSTPNQDNPLMNDVRGGGYPILGLDLWEHAYYLKYRNKRDEYIEKFWDAVNWEFVEKLYQMKLDSKINEATVMEQILLEEDEKKKIGHSHKCTRDEEKVFRTLLFPPFSQDENYKKASEFRKSYVDGWNRVLKNLYPSNWKEENQLYVGHLAGLYDKENRRLLLNNITSSYSVFCIVHNDINVHLQNTGQEVLKYGDDFEENIKTLNRFFSVIDGIQKRLFNRVESNTMKHIEKTLRKTDCYGKRNEDAAKKIIDENLGENTCVIVSGGGIADDMKKGIDAILRLSNADFSAQIKPYRDMVETETHFEMGGTSSAKSYSQVKCFIFVNVRNRSVIITKNENTLIKSGKFLIPKENVIERLVGSPELEFIDCSEYL